MKFLSLVITALACGFAGYATAADLPVTKAPYAAPMAPVTWAGFYIGVDGGLTLDAPFKFNTSLTTVTKIDPRGGTFGGHAGHNWQTGAFVYGFEFDALWNGSSKTVPVGIGANLNSKVDYFGSATARVGISMFNDIALLYARGGLGFAHTAATVTVVPVEAPTISSSAFEVHYGPVVGAGLEFRLFGSSSWLLRVDYQHYMLSKTSYAFGGSVMQANIPASLNLDVITAGLSYKF